MSAPDGYSRFLTSLLAPAPELVLQVSSEPDAELVERAWYLTSSALELDRHDWTRQLVEAIRSPDAAERTAAQFALWRIHDELNRDEDD